MKASPQTTLSILMNGGKNRKGKRSLIGEKQEYRSL
jgi:hypothetical protein